MENRYLKNPEYSYEKSNRASSACGPLVKWAIAQVILLYNVKFCFKIIININSSVKLEYVDMINKVEPLRNELNELEKAANINKNKSENLKLLIDEVKISYLESFSCKVF